MDSYLPHSNLAGMDTPATPEDIARVKAAARKRAIQLLLLADRLDLAYTRSDIRLSDGFLCALAAETLRQLAEGK